jgi:hypothetical protein
MKKIINNIEYNLTAEEIAIKQAEELVWNNGAFDRAIKKLRNVRNNLLNETDWYITKSKENNEEVPTNIKTYRQELRDLTEGLTTAEQVNNILVNNLFPTKP